MIANYAFWYFFFAKKREKNDAQYFFPDNKFDIVIYLYKKKIIYTQLRPSTEYFEYCLNS